LIVTELTTILIGFGFDPNVQDALLGAFILVVALVTGREAHVRNRV
jgi:ribose/xylose/arabinose/galactoside ABC-type transport system permease subunit